MIEDKEKYKLEIIQKSELETTVGYVCKMYRTYADTFHLVFGLIFLTIFSSTCTSVFNLIAFSYLTAFIINPYIAYLSKYFSRAGAIFLIFVLFTLFFVGFFVFLIPGILSDYSKLVEEIPSLVRNLYASLKNNPYFSKIFQNDPEHTFQITDNISKLASYANIKSVVSNLFASFLKGYGLALALINFALFPFIVYYISHDWKKINNLILKAFPDSYEGLIEEYALEAESVTNNFVKGQVLVGIALAILYSIGLLIIGLPYAIPIGIFSGILGIIPYVGFVFGIGFGMLVQGTYDPTLTGFLYLFLAFGIVQFIEGNFVTPKIVGDTMGLHPLLVIVALLVGGDLLGFTGLLFAIPIAALLQAEFKRRVLAEPKPL